MKYYNYMTDIEDNTLIIYIWDIKKSIVCEIKKFSFYSAGLRYYLNRITELERKYNLVIDNQDTERYYNHIKRNAFSIN